MLGKCCWQMLLFRYHYLIVIIVIIVIVDVAFIPGAVSLQCYCTDEGQCTTGYCESQWCLIGVKQRGNVVRMCALDDSLKPTLLNTCQSDVGDWSQVCGCDKVHCNTFNYLRVKLGQSDAQVHSADRRNGGDDHDVGGAVDFSVKDPASAPIYAANDQYYPQHSDFGAIGPVDRPDEQVIISRPDIIHKNAKADGTLKFGDKINPKESHLMIVLIVVPLSVGASAVIVILLNYYCKLC